MGSIRRADYDEVDVRVFEDAVQCAVYADGNAESFLQFPAGRGGVALKNGSEREEVGQCEDERDVECETSETDTKDARLNGRWSHVSRRQCSALSHLHIYSRSGLTSAQTVISLTWSFPPPFFYSFGCTSSAPNCLCRHLLFYHLFPPLVHSHPVRIASRIHNGPHCWGIFCIFTRRSVAVAFRARSGYPGETIALSMMGRMSISTCLADTMMPAVRTSSSYLISCAILKPSLLCIRLHKVHIPSGQSSSSLCIPIALDGVFRALPSCQYAGELPTLEKVFKT